MRGFATASGLLGITLASVFWLIVATTHSIYAHPGPGPIEVSMFLLLLTGAIGSVLAAYRVRWAPALIAIAAIPGAAAYLIPGLMILAAALAAANADRELPTGAN